jgi:hypothetical protein
MKQPSEIMIKGQTLAAWDEWITNELAPPVVMAPEVRYVTEALRDAISALRSTPPATEDLK